MAIYSPTHSRTSLITPTTHPRLLPPVLPISTHLDTRFVTYTSQDAETIPDAASNPVELERHPDLWFEDGSIVLRAENTLFLVHMSQLSRHSVCFRDMFSMPQLKQGPLATAGAASSSKIVAHSGELEKLVLDDGQECSVVYLHDAAEDLGNLLTALYDGPRFGLNDNDDFRIVSGILRLSTKYIIDSLRDKTLAHLGVVWPTTLKNWDAREDLARSHELNFLPGDRLYPSPVAVINLAREVDAPALLPSAFYDLSRYSFAQILEPSDDEPPGLPHSPTPLSLSDTHRLALGKESSSTTVTSLIQAMGRTQLLRHPQHHGPPSSSRTRKDALGRSCVSAATCRKDFSELMDLATQHYLFDRERGCLDPLYVAEELGQLKSAELSECGACAKSLEAWAAREREKMWKMIPMWFRLEAGPR